MLRSAGFRFMVVGVLALAGTTYLARNEDLYGPEQEA